jgi:hypothetical protein
MPMRIEGEIAWDGQALSALVTAGGDPILCIVPREIVHGVSPYLDAIDREIERDKAEILDRMGPIIRWKIDSGLIDRTGPVARLQLELADLDPRKPRQ